MMEIAPNFLTEIIDGDIENGLQERIHTRFPPEPQLLRMPHFRLMPRRSAPCSSRSLQAGRLSELPSRSMIPLSFS